jgi:biotin carboxylase
MVLVPTTTYRATDYLEAAAQAGVQLVVGSERRQSLEPLVPGGTCVVPWDDPAKAVSAVREFHRTWALAGVVGADDETTEAAAAVAEAFGWRAADRSAVSISRDKALFREALEEGCLETPPFRVLSLEDELSPQLSGWTDWPAVLKPRNLAASRGVMRVNSVTELKSSLEILSSLLSDREKVPGKRVIRDSVLLEGYLYGEEYSFDGIWLDGTLQTLAWFDKPNPMRGPTFAETLFVTPSEAGETRLRAMFQEIVAACREIGLTAGPLHAELRYTAEGPVLLELAPRTIGGLCARVLRFAAGLSLEALVLRYAARLPLEIAPPSAGQAGAVHMIPVLQEGEFVEIKGIESARAVIGVEGVERTVHPGDRLIPLPEGNRYVGFVYARAQTSAEATAAVTGALSKMTLVVKSGGSLAEIPADALP